MAVLLVLSLLFTGVSRGAEAPVGSPPWTRMMKAGYLKAVRAHIKSKLLNGVFKIHDDVLDRDWRLKFAGLRRDRVASTADGLWFTCADFQAVDDEHKLDVDFYARKAKDAWVVEKAAIHKLDGQARFLYNDRNEPVPAQ